MSWGYVATRPWPAEHASSQERGPGKSESLGAGERTPRQIIPCASSWMSVCALILTAAWPTMWTVDGGCTKRQIVLERPITWQSGQRWYGRHGTREEDTKKAPAGCNIARLPWVSVVAVVPMMVVKTGCIKHIRGMFKRP